MNYTKYQDTPNLTNKPTPTIFDIFKPYLYFVLLIAYLGIGVFWVKSYMAIKKTETLIEELGRKIVIRKYRWDEDWGRRVMFTSRDGADTSWIVEDGYILYGVYGNVIAADTLFFNAPTSDSQ